MNADLSRLPSTSHIWSEVFLIAVLKKEVVILETKAEQGVSIFRKSLSIFSKT